MIKIKTAKTHNLTIVTIAQLTPPRLKKRNSFRKNRNSKIAYSIWAVSMARVSQTNQY